MCPEVGKAAPTRFTFKADDYVALIAVLTLERRDMQRDRVFALMEACFVTFLWSSSYILVKIGLTQLSPLILVSLRYIAGSVVLVTLAVLRGEIPPLKDLGTILKLSVLGFSGYTMAQGLQCLGLFYLPAVSVTFILNFTPIIVLILGGLFLQEYPTRLQVAGITLVMAGAYLFFQDPFSEVSLTGVAITLLSGFGWAAYLVLSRRLFIKTKASLLGSTAFSMGFGTVLMAVGAYAFEGLPVVSPSSWGIILWLGVTNTALAFFLWNHALQKLEAFEISILQNTMLVQISLLSWVFLGEPLTPRKGLSMLLVFAGVLLVQLKKLK
ncbi:MAG: EamA family transporter [Candidatus Bathyarchaeota archaeon]|nr:EamA family transporter [Candidatus Bathyarchaeota archaeon]